LRIEAAAIRVRVVLLPVLVEPAQQVFETDRDRAAFGVLHLHGRTVEAEELPHLVDLERDGPLLHRLEQLV
jgi:hypothetical protein